MYNKKIFILFLFFPNLSSFAMDPDYINFLTEEDTPPKKNNWERIFKGFQLNLTPPVDKYMECHGWEKKTPWLSSPYFTKGKLSYLNDGKVLILKNDSRWDTELKFDYSEDNKLEVSFKLETSSYRDRLKKLGFSKQHYLTSSDKLIYEYRKTYTAEKGELNEQCPSLLLISEYLPKDFFEIEVFIRLLNSEDIIEQKNYPNLTSEEFLEELKAQIEYNKDKNYNQSIFVFLKELPLSDSYHKTLKKIFNLIKKWDPHHIKKKALYYDDVIFYFITSYFEILPKNEHPQKRGMIFQESLELLLNSIDDMPKKNIDEILSRWINKIIENREFRPIASEEMLNDQILDKILSPEELFKETVLTYFYSNKKNHQLIFKLSMSLLANITIPKKDL